jgi:outer membrane protein assembly factor BamE
MMRAIILQALAMRPTFLLILVSLATLHAGCVYRMNIQQGNYIEAKTVDQLQTGMTRSQVRYLLGTPMVPDAFDDDRWDYVYYLKKGRLRAPEQRHLVVRFQEGKVVAVNRLAMPKGEKLPMPEPDKPSPASAGAVAPSDPAATQPENPGATQPGSPRPPSTQPQPPVEEPPPEPRN